MKKKNRRVVALIILIVMFSALTIYWKCLVIGPMLAMLMIDWDEFTYNGRNEGINAEYEGMEGIEDEDYY